MKEENSLTGFTVYSQETGYPVYDRKWAVTSDGVLLMKGRNGYIEVPKEGKFIVQYGAGCLERW